MADMELAIKISEEEYMNIKKAINSLIEHGLKRDSLSQVCLAILDGTPLPKEQWIKCSDHLPDFDVDVLGTRKEYGDVVIVARHKSYIEYCGWEWIISDDVEGNSYKHDEIIAWMPLPEGFKEEENNDT